MMLRTLTLASLAALLVVAAPVRAQMAGAASAKNAATNAVNATNARTDAVTRDQGASDKAGAKPAGVAMPHSAAAQRSAPAPASEQPETAASRSAGSQTPGSGATPMAAAANKSGTTGPGEGKNEMALMREAFSYESEGRRDPFLSLLATGELRPMIQDLRLVAVIYDAGGRSVAILRDVSAKEQYRVKVGQAVGRMRVVQITPKAVTFTLEEFGYSRQEVLALNVQPK